MSKKRDSLDRNLELVERKLREADYFLTRMSSAGLDGWAFACDLSAFLSSARSVTFTMQSVMRGHPRWTDWYDLNASELKGPRSTLMVTLRNMSEKNGDIGVVSGSMRRGIVTHYFDPRLTADLADNERSTDVLELCRRHMGTLVHVVAAWMADFEDCWGLPIEIDDADEPALGWQRHLSSDGSEFVLLGSPGETAPVIPDLIERWPHQPDPASL